MNLSPEEKERFDNLSTSDQLKLEKIFAMMKAEKDAKKATNEDFDSVVDDIMDQGKSEEDAKKIAGAINAKYVGNYREGVEEGIKEGVVKKIRQALIDDAKGTDVEIDSYMDSLRKSGDSFDDIDDFVEDFKNYVADRGLQEHFGRFLKDFQ